MRRFLVWLAAGALVGAATPAGLAAQGYGIYEHSACMMARAGTGVASSCGDGSAVFFNPAGILGSGKGVLSAGATVIMPRGGFTSDISGTTTDLKKLNFVIPHLYWTRDLGADYAVGFGVFAPYGLTTEWPTTFEGRFLGYRSKIQSIYLQPTFAARVSPTLTVGAGLDYSLVSVNLRQRADLYSTTLAPGVTGGNLGFQKGTDFADVDLEGDGNGIGFNVGVTWKAHPRVSVGARYLSQQNIYIDQADANITQIQTGLVLAAGNPLGLPAGTPVDAVVAPQFTGTGALVDQKGSTRLTFPDQFTVGATFTATQQLRVLADVQWVHWKKFETLALQFERLPQRIIQESYENSTGVRLGAEYDLGTRYMFRAGVLSHGAAAPDQTVTPNLPEGPRSEFTAGLGAQLTPTVHLDLAYQYIDQADRRGRTTDGGLAQPTAAVNNGLYTFNAHLVGATLTYKF
ncbi:MAG TPA: outer membrane protein transport protein [Gemmatimonadales bacterium]|nr:outer membrane protein transport protein [Gemmatimonadales bacterium]